jgi:hypothetical protein
VTDYRKRHYSGICVCGHDSEDYSNATGESRIAGECEFYGWNECTDNHCPMYWDKDNPDPDPDPYASRRPQPDPSVKFGGC